MNRNSYLLQIHKVEKGEGGSEFPELSLTAWRRLVEFYLSCSLGILVWERMKEMLIYTLH